MLRRNLRQTEIGRYRKVLVIYFESRLQRRCPGWDSVCRHLANCSEYTSADMQKASSTNTNLIIARTVFDQLLSWVLGKKPLVQIGLGSPKTKFQSYRPINDTLPSIFVFGSIIMVKEPLTELKFAIFKNWLDTRPKMETHEPRVYPTILGGVSRGFWSPFEDLGARSAIFWHLKRPKVPREKPPKMVG